MDTSESLLTAVQGWSGADAADQDFMYTDSWYEVKSIGTSAVSVTISSLEQLDCDDEGELVIMRIDKVAPDRKDAISLNDVVHRIIAKLSDHVEALDLFRMKLTAYGYIDLLEYSEQKYLYSTMQRYRVDKSFPKLTSQLVPVQIVSLHYELDLPSLAGWLKR
jgi:hypothetical protein